MKKLLIGGAVLALAVPALAQVAPATSPVPQMKHVAKVQTRADVQTKVAEHFNRMDSNRDGFLTKAEADAAAQAFGGKRAERRAERGEQRFEQIDTNRDGSITRSEWDSAQAQRQQRIAARDQNGDGRADRARFGHHGMGGFGGRMFEMADANHDGRVTLQEAQTAALQHFDMVDTNRDGRITPDERMRMHQHMRTDHKQG